MIQLTQKIDDPNGLVSKLVFEDNNGAIAESVIYRYQDRGVVCFSVQSGCPVGCVFCGTGKNFIRNLSTREIQLQMKIGHEMIADCKKKQFMSMSMGEPMLNYYHLQEAIRDSTEIGLNPEIDHFYVSTVGVNDPEVLEEILNDGAVYPHFGLQFSLHSPYQNVRWKLLGRYSNLMTLSQIKLYASIWKAHTTKPVYFNYICKNEPTPELTDDIHAIVEGQHLTLSVLCNTKGFAKGDPAPALAFSEMILERHPDQDVTVFDPAGQDTIGGGCGQLLYVQKKLEQNKERTCA